jgi:hypothetical protein
MKPLLAFFGGNISHVRPWIQILVFVAFTLVGGILVIYWQNKD